MAFIPPRKVKNDTDLPGKVDVAIIGGGIVGASAALSLAEHGVTVALCEKGAIGAEQSSRNWGWVRQMGRDPAEVPLIIRSLALWSELTKRVGADTGFRKTGVSYLCRSEKQLAGYDSWLRLAREYDIPTKVVGAVKLKNLLPGIAEGFHSALHTATDGMAEPHLVTPAIAQAARSHGARILQFCAVRGLEMQGGKVCGVITERGTVACEQAILAGGSWSRLFAGNLGISIPQLKVLATAARINAVRGLVPAMPVAADTFAFRRRADGGYTIARRNANIAQLTMDNFRLFKEFAPALAKGWREIRIRAGSQFIEDLRVPRHWQYSESTPFEQTRTLDPKPAPRLTKDASRRLGLAFPAFSQCRISDEWAGIIDVTPDAVPIIGAIREVPGLHVATGFSGHGFGLGPAAGELIADLVRGDQPKVDPSPFRFERYRRKSRG